MTEEAASDRLSRYGPNELPEAAREGWVAQVAAQFRSPMILFLFLAAIVTAVQREWFDVIVIVVILLLNASLGLWQAGKSEADVRALQKLSSPEATVVREGSPRRVPAAHLVPGDTVQLESGDRVPADIRVEEVNGLQVDESMLTGEVLPAVKDRRTLPSDAVIGDRVNMSFSGTLVVSGRATGLVVATGSQTQLGTIADLVQGKSAKTPLQMLTDRLERLIGAVVILLALVVLVSGVVMGTPVSEAFRTTVALIVAAMPEALPIVLTVAMGVGVSRMARHNAVVRRLHSVETLGSTNVIGSDKTGTLTVNRMTVEQVWTPDNTTPAPFNPAQAPETFSPAERASLRTGGLTNGAVAQDGQGHQLLGDAVDVAMATAALKAGVLTAQQRSSDTVIADMPYEPDLAFSQTVRPHADSYVLHVKGAPETVLSFCTSMMVNGEELPVDAELVEQANAVMGRSGLRVIATAHAVLDGPPQTAALPRPEELTFSGLQAMMDPPRAGVEEAIAECRSAGIHVMMITGDHPATAEAIGERLGLAANDQPLTGAELEDLSDAELLERLRRTSVAARMSPQDKLRIVQVLQSADQTVAVTGDGVNDAPALKAASIGVAMGDSGTDVARESSDVVLTDDNFVTIVDAVRQGRVTFASIRKATFFLLSNGLAALIAVAVNTFTDLPLIFLPVMLLFMNVVTNGIQDIALSFEKGEGDELAQKPRPRGEGVLNRTMWLRTVITGTWMGMGTLVVYQLAHDAGLSLDHCRTLALITMVMFNFFQVFSARAERRSLFALNPLGNPLLLVSALLALLLQWGATVWPVSAELIGLAPLSLGEWLMCTALGSTVLLIVEAEKLVRRVARKTDRGAGSRRASLSP